MNRNMPSLMLLRIMCYFETFYSHVLTTTKKETEIHHVIVVKYQKSTMCYVIVTAYKASSLCNNFPLTWRSTYIYMAKNTITNLAIPCMRLCMHDRQCWLDLLCSQWILLLLCRPWPKFTDNILPHVLDSVRQHEVYMEIMRIGIHLPPIHIYCLLGYCVSTSDNCHTRLILLSFGRAKCPGCLP